MRLLHGADRRQAGEILRQGGFDRGRQTGADDRGARHARNDRTRCSRPFSTSRPGNAATACRGSSSPRRHCSMRTRRRAGKRSPGRSTTISAAAAAMRAFCAPSRAPPRRCGRRVADERWTTPIAGASATEPQARPVDRVSRGGKSADIDRAGRDRAGGSDRDAADRGRGTRRRSGAHRVADRRHRADPERGLYGGQPVDPVRGSCAAARLRRGQRTGSRPCRRRVRIRARAV